MGRPVRVPITPAVLKWAIDQSGYLASEVAASADVSVELLRAWLSGHDRPTLTQLRALATKLRRPLAAFLLPAAPAIQLPAVQFRRQSGEERRSLNPAERLALRDAARLQRVVAWSLSEAGALPTPLPKYSTSHRAESAADAVRVLLNLSTDAARSWQTPAEALRGWRAALEEIGVLALLLPIGHDSCKGFSLWDDLAPLIAVNTGLWNTEARIFTVLHELGHLVTRTSSACTGLPESLRAVDGDPIERWCEEFAGALLLPAEEIQRFLKEDVDPGARGQVSELRLVAKLARANNASLRATTLRLIKAGFADPKLYAAIPKATDHKRRGGGGGGRVRAELRRDQLGDRPARVLLTAVENGVLSKSAVLDHLGLSYGDLDVWASQVSK